MLLCHFLVLSSPGDLSPVLLFLFHNNQGQLCFPKVQLYDLWPVKPKINVIINWKIIFKSSTCTIILEFNTNFARYFPFLHMELAAGPWNFLEKRNRTLHWNTHTGFFSGTAIILLLFCCFCFCGHLGYREGEQRFMGSASKMNYQTIDEQLH